MIIAIKIPKIGFDRGDDNFKRKSGPVWALFPACMA
jgi:hypothetical protein